MVTTCHTEHVAEGQGNISKPEIGFCSGGAAGFETALKEWDRHGWVGRGAMPQ